ncbi:MAG: gluconate 2-dehydrogenase subunit 3 family protein [Gemmatimonadota bacterium]|nr:gluconate 2-dehydrogenase subunit 3 family protein [Gemmatimonadota bacterium]
MPLSRREFVHGVAALWLGAALACRRTLDPEAASHAPPPDSPAPPRVLGFLTEEQAADVEAIAARIFPTDETPGAREAGVIWFIDQSLTGFASDQQEFYTAELAALETAVAAAHPVQRRFAALTESQQDALLTARQDTPFFGAVRFATIAGMFALPKYGGNADYLGWQLIGQETGHEFTPPFGWYDHPDNQRALLGRVL